MSNRTLCISDLVVKNPIRKNGEYVLHLPFAHPRGHLLRIRRTIATSVLFSILVPSILAWAADDINIERLATCQDSWREWKNEPLKYTDYLDYIDSNFTHKKNYEHLVPKSEMWAFGFRVLQLSPNSLGQAAGFTVIVDADFDVTRKKLETTLNGVFEKCETSENLLGCEVGDRKFFVILSEELEGKVITGIGCGYY